MIESILHNGVSEGLHPQWHEVPNHLAVERVKFCTFYYRINDTMYLQDSEMFREAFSKERVWEKLNK